VHANHWHFFRHFLHDAHPAYTPEKMDRYIEVVTAGRGDRDDQLLPERGAAVAEARGSADPPHQRAHAGHLGTA
jgi:hypothetical protein